MYVLGVDRFARDSVGDLMIRDVMHDGGSPFFKPAGILPSDMSLMAKPLEHSSALKREKRYFQLTSHFGFK